jgi:hypothetical protein
MIALLLTAALCGGLREAVKQAQKPVGPFQQWKAEAQPRGGELQLFRSKRVLAPFASCRVALAKDVSALECELPFDDAAKAGDELERLTKQAGKCLGDEWEKTEPPIRVKYALLGITSWKKRAMEVQLYAQGPAEKLHLGFPVEPVTKGAVVVLTITVE